MVPGTCLSAPESHIMTYLHLHICVSNGCDLKDIKITNVWKSGLQPTDLLKEGRC